MFCRTCRNLVVLMFAAALLLTSGTIRAQQTLYVGNYQAATIDRIAPDGTVTTFASGISFPSGITLDTLGDVYVANGSDGTRLPRSHLMARQVRMPQD